MANLWSDFQALLSEDPLQLGTVQQVRDERTQLLLPSGVTVWVLGSQVPVGKNAYYRQDLLIGEAPDMPISDITIY